ncbi:helix-turn-helix domain-containing protein [Demetria terragena]|uniref:helix-turn-helix domain-containing protein n=1 Tax=Demetria terragena TaxID=63959 RepID=UPI0003811C0E|nr:helix-turn-helix domain-containing protein [Demetria terragena]
MTERDRLRELLDAVLDEDHPRLADMADGAHASQFHFSRLVSRGTGESPVAMRRRVMLERAAWQLREGTSVTDAAWSAGYESVDGFSRAFARGFGHLPSESASNHWLPAPNGIHFHPPTSLWVTSTKAPMNPLIEQLIAHDLADTQDLLETAQGLSDHALRAVRASGTTVLPWDGPEESVLQVLTNLVFAKEVWHAAIVGTTMPTRDESSSPTTLLARHRVVATGWLAVVRDIDERGAWEDRLIDALCDPPESFVMSGVIAHVVTYSSHRRQLARQWMRQCGVEVDEGDPIMWLRKQRQEQSGGDHR